MKKYILEITVFVVGAVVMILELVGARILAPFVGTSIYVWTSLIGIVLGSLSLGYYLGGKAADKDASFRILSKLILLSAIWVILIALFKNPILSLAAQALTDLRQRVVLSSGLLFMIPSVLLGMVSPYALRLKIKSLENSGKTIGNLYALSTVGSIVGTFTCGFYLFSYLGDTNITIMLGVALAILSLIIYRGDKFIPTALLLFLLLLSRNQINTTFVNNFREFDTQYNKVRIFEDKDMLGKNILRMNINNEYSSAMYFDSNNLVYEYTKYYRLVKHFRPDIEKALMVGGAGYSYPKDYLEKFPNSLMDVVEIDPELTELAKKYFNLKDNPRLRIIHEDGRVFLNGNNNIYGAIFVDAFKSDSTPYQLTTVEAVNRIYESLDTRGVVLVNIISSVNGEKGKFLRAELATYRSVFPQVFIYLVGNPVDGDIVQNIILVALKNQNYQEPLNDDQELSNYLSHLWKNSPEDDLPILTDDYAPIDFYTREALAL